MIYKNWFLFDVAVIFARRDNLELIFHIELVISLR